MYEEKQIKELAKELCKKSCHHICEDTTDCVVEDEAEEVIANSATTTEKQIEEITKVLNGKQNGGWKFVGDSEFTTDVFNEEVAKHLYETGYRKQSENTVEVVRCKDCVYFKRSVSALFPHASAFICDYFYGLQKNVNEDDFCCHGAKMKGGE